MPRSMIMITTKMHKKIYFLQLYIKCQFSIRAKQPCSDMDHLMIHLKEFGITYYKAPGLERPRRDLAFIKLISFNTFIKHTYVSQHIYVPSFLLNVSICCNYLRIQATWVSILITISSIIHNVVCLTALGCDIWPLLTGDSILNKNGSECPHTIFLIFLYLELCPLRRVMTECSYVFSHILPFNI